MLLATHHIEDCWPDGSQWHPPQEIIVKESGESKHRKNQLKEKKKTFKSLSEIHSLWNVPGVSASR